MTKKAEDPPRWRIVHLCGVWQVQGSYREWFGFGAVRWDSVLKSYGADANFDSREEAEKFMAKLILRSDPGAGDVVMEYEE